MSQTYHGSSALRKYVDQIRRIFKSEQDKTAAHKLSAPIMEAMTHEGQVLNDIVAMNVEIPGFFARTNYPAPNMRIDSNPHFDMHCNCWVPLPDKNTNMSTKALHHHGPMLLTTATAFGPGYEHWMMTNPVLVDGSEDTYSMTLLDRSHHYLHHVEFVDKYIVHVPMYIPSLTLTYALWSNSRPTTWRDHVKRLKAVERNRSKLRKFVSKCGLSSALDVKPLEYLDYYPVQNGFKQVRFRDQVEFRRGPTAHYLQSIFYVIQQTTGATFADTIERVLKKEPGLSGEDRESALRLVGMLRSGDEIEPKLTPELHYGMQCANFTSEQIEEALAACSAGNRSNEEILHS